MERRDRRLGARVRTRDALEAAVVLASRLRLIRTYTHTNTHTHTHNERETERQTERERERERDSFDTASHQPQ